ERHRWYAPVVDRSWLKITARFAAIAVAGGLLALPAHAAVVTPNDYSKAETWLCRPDIPSGPCHGPLNVLVVVPSGHVTPQIYKPDANARVDCFYVYPTSSEDHAANSDMTPGREVEVVAVQFGQFGARCRQ